MINSGIMDLVVPAVIAVGDRYLFLVHPAQKFSCVPAMVVAFVCYLRTSYVEMPRAERVLPVYVLALAV
jgi:hypothetical protein